MSLSSAPMVQVQGRGQCRCLPYGGGGLRGRDCGAAAIGWAAGFGWWLLLLVLVGGA